MMPLVGSLKLLDKLLRKVLSDNCHQLHPCRKLLSAFFPLHALLDVIRASHVFGHENIIRSLLWCRSNCFEGVQCRRY
jgi:hypothetical protein